MWGHRAVAIAITVIGSTALGVRVADGALATSAQEVGAALAAIGNAAQADAPAVRGAAVQVGPTLPPEPACEAGSLIRRVRTDRREISFTFDDGPWPSATRSIMTALESRGDRGTFFMIGQNVREFPDIAKEVVERGHEIGNHSDSHRYSPQIIASEIAGTQDLIESVTGQRPEFFRSPGLTMGDEIQDAARAAGVCNVFTSVVLGDHLEPRKSASELCARFAYTLQTGEIVLLHDGAGHRETVQAVPCMLDAAAQRGYAVVSLEQLIADGTPS